MQKLITDDMGGFRERKRWRQLFCLRNTKFHRWKKNTFFFPEPYILPHRNVTAPYVMLGDEGCLEQTKNCGMCNLFLFG